MNAFQIMKNSEQVLNLIPKLEALNFSVEVSEKFPNQIRIKKTNANHTVLPILVDYYAGSHKFIALGFNWNSEEEVISYFSQDHKVFYENF